MGYPRWLRDHMPEEAKGPPAEPEQVAEPEPTAAEPEAAPTEAEETETEEVSTEPEASPEPRPRRRSSRNR